MNKLVDKVPDGYALVSIGALKAWGKYDEVRNACQYPAEQAEQEQVAVLDITYGREPECYATPNADDLPEGTYRLYAAPVRKKDLTDDEIRALLCEHWYYEGDLRLQAFARAVIAKDREKNK